jgi:hypothetical protein
VKKRNKHFHEINNIRETSILETSLDNRTDFSNNSILPTQKNINRNTTNNYAQADKNICNKQMKYGTNT